MPAPQVHTPGPNSGSTQAQSPPSKLQSGTLQADSQTEFVREEREQPGAQLDLTAAGTGGARRRQAGLGWKGLCSSSLKHFLEEAQITSVCTLWRNQQHHVRRNLRCPASCFATSLDAQCPTKTKSMTSTPLRPLLCALVVDFVTVTMPLMGALVAPRPTEAPPFL